MSEGALPVPHPILGPPQPPAKPPCRGRAEILGWCFYYGKRGFATKIF